MSSASVAPPLLLKRDKIKIGKLPAGDVSIAFEMKTPLERAAPAELRFWINGEEAPSGTVQRAVPAGFTASETFDVGRDTNSPVANDYSEKAPLEFEGTLKRLHFSNLQAERPAFLDWTMIDGRWGCDASKQIAAF